MVAAAGRVVPGPVRTADLAVVGRCDVVSCAATAPADPLVAVVPAWRRSPDGAHPCRCRLRALGRSDPAAHLHLHGYRGGDGRRDLQPGPRKRAHPPRGRVAMDREGDRVEPVRGLGPGGALPDRCAPHVHGRPGRDALLECRVRILLGVGNDCGQHDYVDSFSIVTIVVPSVLRR